MPSNPETRRKRYAAKRLVQPAPPPGKKRCANCGASFTPNPSREEHRFCKPECRKQFHRFGTSLPALVDKLREVVGQLLTERQAELEKLTSQARQLLSDVKRLHRQANKPITTTRKHTR